MVTLPHTAHRRLTGSRRSRNMRCSMRAAGHRQPRRQGRVSPAPGEHPLCRTPCRSLPPDGLARPQRAPEHPRSHEVPGARRDGPAPVPAQPGRPDAVDAALADHRDTGGRGRHPLRPGEQRERGGGRGARARLLRDRGPPRVRRPRGDLGGDRGTAQPERRGDRHRRAADGIPVAAIDQEAGVRMVLKYLLAQGHERILHVAGPPDWNDAQSRLRAYKAELRAAGLSWAPPLYGDWTADSGYEIGRSLVRGGAELPFTAVFSSNDQMALGLIHAFRAAGLDVPGDISIVGFDDIPESAHFWPPLTTVRQDFGELGVRCVTLLMDAIGRTEAPDGYAGAEPAASPVSPVSPLVVPRLIVRTSVAPV